MGKKFKFSSSLSKGGTPAPPAGSVPPPAKKGGDSDSGLYSIPDNTSLDEEINRRLAMRQEGAARYEDRTIEMDEVHAVGDDFLEQQARQFGLRVIKLDSYEKPPADVRRLLTVEQAKRLLALPVERRSDGVIVVAISDPMNTTIGDTLRAIIDHEIEICVARESEIKGRIDQIYGIGEQSLGDIVARADSKDIMRGESGGARQLDLSDISGMKDLPPIIQWVNILFVKAIKERASDIHIEPFESVIRVRFRIDGQLLEIQSPPSEYHQGIVSRIKVLSNMNIAETRLPQDGRIKMIMDKREIDMRVSTMPTAHGEAIVMRVLDKSMMMIGLDQIGLSDQMRERFIHHIEKPNGIVLVTGPTGSGKTTTLYAALGAIKDPGDKLITVEDPVEYEMAGLVQVNINEAVGLTFGKCLRAILRQDPDTVLVGEIRDVETAQISVQASLTGHLVFSTLHTNSAAATVTRLIDMGVEPFLLTSSIEAIIGQRLVKTICGKCRTPETPSEDDIFEFGLTPEDLQAGHFYRGKGCRECGGMGFRGRLGLFELLEVDDSIRDLILDQATTDEIQAQANRNGMLTMRNDGLLKVQRGLTTLSEVARETPRDLPPEAYSADGEPAAPVGGGASELEDVFGYTGTVAPDSEAATRLPGA